MINYDKYKSSQIDWLGDIPVEWEVKRLKNIFSFFKGLTITKKDLQDTGVYCVNYGEIHSKYGFEVNPKIHVLKCVDENYLITSNSSLLNEGDFVFSDTSEDIEGSGNFTYLNSDTRIFAGYHTIIAKPIGVSNLRYLAYLLDSLKFRHQIRSKVVGIKVFSITQKLLKQLFIILPTNNEQNLIVNFLDTKTQAIDKKINLLAQKSNYYKEYRKSLINETVCNGLDKSFFNKETELGFNVNEKFNKFRLKDLGFLYSGLSGKSGEDFNQDENQNNKGFIPFTNIANNTYLKKDHLGTVVVFENENQNRVRRADIFFLMSSEGYEDIGKSAILDDDLNETYLNSFCKGYRVTNRKANPYFLNYLLLSDNYRKRLTIEGKGFTRINLKMEKVNDFVVFIPNTIDEQNKIVSFLDEKTKVIDKIVSNINTQISTLKELRKTLINDAVTGKIKVVS